MVDMDAVAQSLWTKNNDAQLAKTLVQEVGMMTSAWEHRIPEMLFTNDEHPGEAGTKVKALAIASAEGQRIYQVTSENVNAVLPVLNISTDVKDEIQASVAVGKVATVSQNNITVGSWTGVGYIIADAETGAGAYRISGGANGARFGGFFAGYFATLALLTITFLSGPLALLLTIMFLVIMAGYIYIYATSDKGGDIGTFLEAFLCGASFPLIAFAAFGILASNVYRQVREITVKMAVGLLFYEAATSTPLISCQIPIPEG